MNGFCNACKKDNQPIGAQWTTKSVGFEQYNGEGVTSRVCVACKTKMDAEVEEILKEYERSE